MIRKNTVLIVGAGGSIPYGLPSGRELLNSIVGHLRSADLYSAIYRLTQKDQTQVEAVRSRLTESMIDSIDAFLEKNPDDPFVQDLGKISIAFCLWSKLQGIKTLRSDPEQDWIRLVWNKMHEGTKSFEDLRANAVTFITFNFDTLLETKLSDAIVALYPNVSYQDARAYVNSIVIHVHGTLSQPSNQPEPTDDWLEKAKNDIRVVHQENDKTLLDTLSQCIDKAEVVGFVGFGYHPDNLKKLGFPRNKPDMFGSAFGLGDGEKQQVTRAVGTGYDRFKLGVWDQGCKAFGPDPNRWTG